VLSWAAYQVGREFRFAKGLQDCGQKVFVGLLW
jgi:hypothetical protein